MVIFLTIVIPGNLGSLNQGNDASSKEHCYPDLEYFSLHLKCTQWYTHYTNVYKKNNNTYYYEAMQNS